MSKTKNNLFFMNVKSYFERLRSELKSEQTINSYRDSLNNFRRFLTSKYQIKLDKITFDFITPEVVREYLTWISEHGKSINTRNLRLTAVKGYVKFCAMNDVELVTLELQLSKIKTKTVHPESNRWLTKEQINLLLEQPSKTKIGIRDRFMMMFLFSTGLRLNELIELKLKDIVKDTKYPSIRILGKGSKYRNVPLADDVIENFNYYLTVFHQNINENNYVFYTVIKGHRDKMSPDNIQRITKKYGEMARAIDSSMPVVHPHLFRHSYGAQMYRLGLSLPEISKLLGHSDLSTTEIYAKTDEDIINKAIEEMIGDQPERKWSLLSEDEKLKIMGLK